MFSNNETDSLRSVLSGILLPSVPVVAYQCRPCIGPHYWQGLARPAPARSHWLPLHTEQCHNRSGPRLASVQFVKELPYTKHTTCQSPTFYQNSSKYMVRKHLQCAKSGRHIIYGNAIVTVQVPVDRISEREWS